jgi:tetratricopeptide (TPR) repeat protein
LDKNKEFGLSPAIAKLAEKISKDPSSKLFVPLAEEYRKIGMLDEAIQVLVDGLNANPNYMTARVSLGKMLLEKGNISEAQKEFEKVVAAIPDNLFAHKKLADIYQSAGDRENLLKEYKIILSLGPKDEEVKKALEELEGRRVLSPVETIEQRPEIPPAVEEVLTKISEIPSEEEEVMKVTEIPSEEEEAPAVCSITPDELPTKEWEEEKVEALEAPSGVEEILEENPALVGEVSEEKEGEGIVYELPEEAISPEELGIEIPLKMTPVTEGIRTSEIEKLEASIKKSLPVLNEISAQETGVPPVEELATETLADIYIKQGLYQKADEVYQQILSAEPENMHIHQKREELKFLMNLVSQGDLRKGKESGDAGKIRKLEAWLKNIKERRG